MINNYDCSKWNAVYTPMRPFAVVFYKLKEKID